MGVRGSAPKSVSRCALESYRLAAFDTVTAAVAIACLINPYGVRGAMFPLELFPKISDPANPYKAYVDEFTSLREVMLDQMRGAAGAHPHVRAQVFLLLILPWSFRLTGCLGKMAFVVERDGAGRCGGTNSGPAVWSSISSSSWRPRWASPCLAHLRWLVAIGRVVPAAMLILGGVCRRSLVAARSRFASAAMALGRLLLLRGRPGCARTCSTTGQRPMA